MLAYSLAVKSFMHHSVYLLEHLGILSIKYTGARENGFTGGGHARLLHGTLLGGEGAERWARGGMVEAAFLNAVDAGAGVVGSAEAGATEIPPVAAWSQ
jgi:hypothetical protein